VKLGVKFAEAGYYLSIPSAVTKSESPFRRLVAELPVDRILTETDCPYMGPERGVRNDPTTVVRGVAAVSSVYLKIDHVDIRIYEDEDRDENRDEEEGQNCLSLISYLHTLHPHNLYT
jgi:TatD DNase family protein